MSFFFWHTLYIHSGSKKCSTRLMVHTMDFNAGVGTLFENELLELCGKHSLHMSDYSILGRSSGTFTYISDAHLTTSWLDHVLCSYNMNLLINSLHVLNKLPCSDHLPMVVIFDIDINVSLPTQVSTDDVITSFN